MASPIPEASISGVTVGSRIELGMGVTVGRPTALGPTLAIGRDLTEGRTEPDSIELGTTGRLTGLPAAAGAVRIVGIPADGMLAADGTAALTLLGDGEGIGTGVI